MTDLNYDLRNYDRKLVLNLFSEFCRLEHRKVDLVVDGTRIHLPGCLYGSTMHGFSLNIFRSFVCLFVNQARERENYSSLMHVHIIGYRSSASLFFLPVTYCFLCCARLNCKLI